MGSDPKPWHLGLSPFGTVPYNVSMANETQSRRLWRLSAMGFTFVSMIIAGGLTWLGNFLGFWAKSAT